MAYSSLTVGAVTGWHMWPHLGRHQAVLRGSGRASIKRLPGLMCDLDSIALKS